MVPNIFTGELSKFYSFFNTFFWSLGAYVAISSTKKRLSIIHNANILALSFCIILSLFTITYIQGSDIRQNTTFINQILIHCVVLLTDVVGSLCFYNLIRYFFWNTGVKWYTRTSFLIYAMHKPIMQAYNKIIAKLFTANLFSHLLNLFGGIIFTTTVLLLTILIMNKIMPKTLILLNRGKKIFL